MRIEPYLNFDGRCDEAIEFYKKAVGAEVQMLMRFKQAPPEAFPDGQAHPDTGDKVMHANLRIGDSTILLSDGRCTAKTKFEGISLSLSVKDEQEADRAFSALSAGGKVTMPMTKTFFASHFGMVIDRFGVMWMVIVQP